MAWIFLNLNMEGYFQVDLKPGQTAEQAAQDIMENGDFESPQSVWLQRLITEGIVSVGATVGTDEGAQRWKDMLAMLEKPHNPKDFVEVERPHD